MSIMEEQDIEHTAPDHSVNEKSPLFRPKMKINLHSLIQQVLEKYGANNTAIVYDSYNKQETISYDELFELIKKCSEKLQMYCKCNAYVGIDTAATNIDTIVAFLSLVNIRAIACPLDLQGESEQAKKLIKTLNITCILVNKVNLESKNIKDLILSGKWSVDNLSILEENLVLCKRNSSECEKADNNEFGIEFVVQSSGSTGPSKTIKVPGKCIYPNILDLCTKFNVSTKDVVFLSSPLTFDASVVQIFISLLGQATLLMVPDDIKKQPSKLCNVLFERNRTTVLQASPSLIKQLGQQLLNDKKTFSDTSVRVLSLGAEPLPSISTLKKMIDNLAAVDLYNIYGISEVSSWASLEKVNLGLFQGNQCDGKTVRIMPGASDEMIERYCERNVPIGDPLSDTIIELRAKDGKRVINGFGEIWIGGKDRVCLVGDEESLTENTMRFSGDIGLIKNGRIFYVERRDNRVKIFGKFVDLEIIEEITEELPYVESAICLKIESTDDLINDSYLTLFVSCVGDAQESRVRKEILAELSSRLPAYCVPSNIQLIQNIPLTSHGKKDRNALREITKSLSPNTDVMSSDSIEKSVLRIFENVLHNKSYVSVQCANGKSFIENGGNSFMAVYVENEICKLVNSLSNEKVELPMLFDYILSKDIRSLLRYMDDEICRSIESERVLELKERVDFKRTFDDSEKICELGSPDKKKNSDLRWLGATKDVISIARSQQTSSPSYDTGSCYCSISRGNRKTICVPCSKKASSSNSQNESNLDLINDIELDVIWKTDTRKCVDASPLIVQGDCEDSSVVYIGSHSHHFLAIEFLSGRVIWDTELGDRIESSAALSKDGESVIVGCYDYMIYVINRLNGEIKWKFKTGDCVKSSAAVHPETGVAYMGSHDQYLYALDVVNCVELWRTYCGGGSCFSSPAVATESKMVLIGTLAGNLVAIDSDKGDIRWMFSTGKPIFSSPMINNETICFGCVDSYIYALNMEGKNLWKIKTKGPIFSSPLFISSSLPNMGSLIVIGSHDGRVYCISTAGCLIWSFKTDSPVYSTSSLVESTTRDNSGVKSQGIPGRCIVVSSTDGKLYVIDIKSGKKIGFIDLNCEIFSSPIVYGNKIVIGCRDNNVCCIQMSFSK